MEASEKPNLSFDEATRGRALPAVGDRLALDGPSVSPEGVARLHLMVNFVLPRLTKS